MLSVDGYVDVGVGVVTGMEDRNDCNSSRVDSERIVSRGNGTNDCCCWEGSEVGVVTVVLIAAVDGTLVIIVGGGGSRDDCDSGRN